MSASDHSSFIPPALMIGTTSRYPILLATRGMLVFVPMAGKYPFQGPRHDGQRGSARGQMQKSSAAE
jgi:hypothetical protein